MVRIIMSPMQGSEVSRLFCALFFSLMLEHLLDFTGFSRHPSEGKLGICHLKISLGAAHPATVVGGNAHTCLLRQMVHRALLCPPSHLTGSEPVAPPPPLPVEPPGRMNTYFIWQHAENTRRRVQLAAKINPA